MSSSSWSDLPPDLLISIRENLIKYYERIDLMSFRSVCSQWRSCMPIPSTLPRYEINYLRENNAVEFISKKGRVISSPLSFDSTHIHLLECSNGWMVFKAGRDDITLHLFEPVSNRRLIFPRIKKNLLRRYKKYLKYINNARGVSMLKAVVSSSTGGGVVAVAIITLKHELYDQLKGWLAFCRYGKDESWSFLIEEREEIRDIVVGGDGRFYAIDENWELYILEERPPTMTLKKCKIMVPKHILEPDLKNDPSGKRAIINCTSMEMEGGTYLKIHGDDFQYRADRRYITLKLDITKISRSSNINVNVGCEAEWSKDFYSVVPMREFTPIVKSSIEIE